MNSESRLIGMKNLFEEFNRIVYFEAQNKLLLCLYYYYKNNKVLYTGCTNDLRRRIFEHKYKLKEGFSSKYNVSKLVYIEHMQDSRSAEAREKQIKGWLRSKKIKLIEFTNPHWKDLAEKYELTNKELIYVTLRAKK